MLGAIAGDVIGSSYEWNSTKKTDFILFKADSEFTDDTVLTVAIAYSILKNESYVSSLKRFGNNYPAGYGASFYEWLNSKNSDPYNSWVNGSAMRVSPVAYAFNSIDEVLEEAKKSAEVTHNHPEGIKGAKATALAIYLARTGETKQSIKKEITKRFDYNLERTLEKIRPNYAFEVSCQKSVPESIIAFLEANSYEEAVRNAVSLGGDSDTMACISGSIAEAFYKKIPKEIVENTKKRLPAEFLEIIDEFYSRYIYNKTNV